MLSSGNNGGSHYYSLCEMNALWSISSADCDVCLFRPLSFQEYCLVTITQMRSTILPLGHFEAIGKSWLMVSSIFSSITCCKRSLPPIIYLQYYCWRDSEHQSVYPEVLAECSRWKADPLRSTFDEACCCQVYEGVI